MSKRQNNIPQTQQTAGTVAARGAACGPMQKITLHFWDLNQQPTIRKVFNGRWLVGSPTNGIEPEEYDSQVVRDYGTRYAVAETAHGQIALYEFDCNGRYAPELSVFEDFAHMRDAVEDKCPPCPVSVLAETASALGVMYEVELAI